MREAPQPLFGRTFDDGTPTRPHKIVLHLAIPPSEVIAWRVLSDCEITVRDARVWMTRAGSDYDFWLQPGDPAIAVQRGERIWLTTDAAVDAEVSLSMANTGAVRWLLHIWSRVFF